MSIGSIGDIGPFGLGGSNDIQGTTSAEDTGIPTGASTVSKADKKAAEELLAMLPKPWIDAVLSLNLWNNLDLSLGLVGAADGKGGNVFNQMEAAIVLAIADSWIKSEAASAEALRQDIIKQDSNGMNMVLQTIIKEGIDSATINSSFQSLQFLKNSPILLSMIKSLDPDTVAKAYTTAEAAIVTNLLNNWIAQEAQLAALQRAKDRDTYINNRNISLNMLKGYIEDVQANKQQLSQPMISVLMAGMMAGSFVFANMTIDPTTHAIAFNTAKDSVLPVGQTPIADLFNSVSSSMPADTITHLPQLALEMTQLMSMVVLSAAYWSIPGAVSLLTAETEKNENAITKQAAFSFAMTMVQFVLRPDFDAFFQGRMLQNIDLKSMNPMYYAAFTAALKVVMLTCALAALHKALTGTALTGADFLAIMGGTIPLGEGDFRSTIIKLIQEQLASIPEKMRQQLLFSLASYLNTNPRFESLYDPTKAFLRMWNPRFSREASLQHSA